MTLWEHVYAAEYALQADRWMKHYKPDTQHDAEYGCALPSRKIHALAVRAADLAVAVSEKHKPLPYTYLNETTGPRGSDIG